MHIHIFNIAGYVPSSCVRHLNHAFETPLEYKKGLFFDFEKITGVNLQGASKNDIQRYFKCKDGFLPKLIQSECNDRGLQFPASCSSEPCDGCSAFPGMCFFHGHY